jgi:hypothetical protein
MAMFPILFIWKKKTGKMLFISFLCILFLTGCFQHFFRSGTLKGIDASTIQRLQSQDKYFILHAENKVMAMNNLKIGKDKLEADLSLLPLDHLKYLEPKTEKPNLIKAKDKPVTLTEVHMYYPGKFDSTQSHFSAPISEFSRIDVYEFDPGTTTFNHVMSVVGVAAGAASVIGVISFIAFAIACNCPQVFIDNRNNYEFVSGVYSGSIYASMERSDYLPLPASETENELKLKIANVKNEEQYINRIQLMKINHRVGVNVLIDRHGNALTYNIPQPPFKASINNSTDIRKSIAAKDNESYSFNSEKNENGFSSATFTFKKPANAQKAKLIVHGGNSLWSGYIYHRFAEMFGDKYETWRSQKDTSDPKVMEQWQKDQSLPLMVYIEKNGQWEMADYFAHTGNTATRDMIMELDVSNIKGDEIKIKMETAYQFWNLDYAVMDFSADETMGISLINATSAYKTGNTDQKESLEEKDKKYCKLLADEEVSLTFNLQDEKKKDEISLFLISTGYYHNIQKYPGTPDLKTLNSFKTKGRFDDYSRSQFSIIQESLAKASKMDPGISNK